MPLAFNSLIFLAIARVAETESDLIPSDKYSTIAISEVINAILKSFNV